MLVVLVGCAGMNGKPEQAADAPPECSRTSSPTGTSASSGIVWADAAGEEVPGVAQLTTLSYVDGDGNVWGLNPWGWTADQAFRSFESLYSSQIVYETDKCDDPWVFAPAPPRFVTQLGDAYYVAPDDAQTKTLSDVYIGDTCEATSVPPADGILLSAMVPATFPGLTWTPPLHPEWR
jgi:hypothetical protein